MSSQIDGILYDRRNGDSQAHFERLFISLRSHLHDALDEVNGLSSEHVCRVPPVSIAKRISEDVGTRATSACRQWFARDALRSMGDKWQATISERTLGAVHL